MFRLQYGLKLPPGEDPSKPITFDGMRQRIAAARRDSSLINMAVREAEFAGLSGEDKYTMLAYRALIQLEEMHDRVMRFVESTPAPPIMLDPKKVQE